MTLSPHELIKLPHGKATKELRKAGLWDETAIMDGIKEFIFDVKVIGHYTPVSERETYKVVAKSEDDAISQVEDLCDYDVVEDIDVISIKEFLGQ